MTVWYCPLIIAYRYKFLPAYIESFLSRIEPTDSADEATFLMDEKSDGRTGLLLSNSRGPSG